MGPPRALVEALTLLGAGRDLSADQAHDALAALMTGEAPEPLIAALLVALHVKGETPAELAGAVRAVRAHMTPLEGPFPPLLDTCGTGGDGARTVNISTATALVVSCCGVSVAKHGNRSASGNSGSAEVLAELGVAIEAEPAILRSCLSELGLCFLFAPRFHPALRFAAPVRKLLPFRTLFNLIGPLANPARPAFQLLGVPGSGLAELLAGALAELGVERAAVVTGSDGLDEVTLAGPTQVLWVERGEVRPEVWCPEDFGLPVAAAGELSVSGPVESAECLRRLLAGGQRGPVRDVVLANSAAALLVARRVTSLGEGVEIASAALDSGEAARKLERWAALSQGGLSRSAQISS